MGYRVRLGMIPKTEKEKYSKMKSKEEFSINCDKGIYTHSPDKYKQIYQIGKYFDEAKNERSDFYPFELIEKEFSILSKEGLAIIIDWYRNQTFEYYKKMKYKTGDDRKIFIEGRIRVWDKSKYGVLPYYLDEERTDGEIVRSWDIEYAIFNLVYIYRTFDWENDYLIYSGW